ncbi:DMT family transporter [Neotabrizicola shimadae]|uniref:DMT family transporter n=1 Tax=Neotabrizicola shimadae TaxID=2807096 RepID=A0A8G0ZVI1_9RHOB|nr:DMT family transporter [Neotabrizicola shimadae]QYZ70175.1 DMT family transporter [Neotabrizicola shimadae]
MPAFRPDRRLGFLIVTASTLAWSTAGLFIRFIDLDTASVLVWRGVFATLGLLAVLLATQGLAGFKGFARLGRTGWLYTFISTAGMFLYIGALTNTSIAHVSVIYAAVPFLAAGLGWLMLGERPPASALLACAAALAGAVIMVGFGHDGTLLGDLMALGMTIGMAFLIVIGRRSPDIPTLPAGALSGVIAAVVALPFATTLHPTGEQIMLLAAFGLVNSAIGFSLFLIGSRHLPPVETALLGALEAPVAPLWVWLVFNETPAPATLIGGTVVMAAVIAHILAENRRPAPT